jgi:hypothetical protein
MPRDPAREGDGAFPSNLCGIGEVASQTHPVFFITTRDQPVETKMTNTPAIIRGAVNPCLPTITISVGVLAWVTYSAYVIRRVP